MLVGGGVMGSSSDCCSSSCFWTRRDTFSALSARLRFLRVNGSSAASDCWVCGGADLSADDFLAALGLEVALGLSGLSTTTFLLFRMDKGGSKEKMIGRSEESARDLGRGVSFWTIGGFGLGAGSGVDFEDAGCGLETSQ